MNHADDNSCPLAVFGFLFPLSTVLSSINYASTNVWSLRLFLLFWHILMSDARLGVEPKANKGVIVMRLFEL